MEEKNLKSWSEFRSTIEEIRHTYGYYEYSIGKDRTHKQKNIMLFRGQASAKWHLQTTLERKTDKKFTLMKYLANVMKRIHEIESYTNVNWNLPSESS
ncbi:MAG TPA: hypothetical protein VJ987_09270, partial [Anaerolineales bacterium]|nr:hypothetical protein [Anaerolineales bacterium]